ncbi:MAG: zinc-binding alcohol dehydrogenase [Candidatus Sumerlaeia bacterium]|nr:zinc-binding alcohol dehydrogenase [Candidatus Sumerlaeia bacterium]
MKVVIAHRNGTVQVVEVDEPGIARGCVQVRVSHSAVPVADDLARMPAAAAARGARGEGLPLGSGVSGIIEEAGQGVKRLRAGLRVAAYGVPYVYHAERLVVPQNLVVELPKKVNHEEGAFVGQGAIAVNMLRRSGLQLGETAIVFGAELLGLLACQVLKAAGVHALLIDPSELRLNKARSIGVSSCLRPDDPDAVVRAVEAMTDGLGADAAFLTRPGDALSLRAAAELLRPRGRIVLGAQPGRAELPARVAEKQLALEIADDPGPGRGLAAFERHGLEFPREFVRWNERDNMACFAALLGERKVQITPLVTDRVPVERAGSLYEKAMRGADQILAAVLTM